MNYMPSLLDIIFAVIISCIIIDSIISISNSIWDTVENRIAKKQEHDILKK